MSEKEDLYLATIGLTFPTSEEELNAFNNAHNSENYELDADTIDPFKILEKINNTDKVLNKSQSYFRRAVLGAKIANECYDEITFGVVKLQKLVYLGEEISEMKFAADYRKQAAGPMNHKFIHSIKTEFEKQRWFSVNQVGEYKKWVFTPLENVTGFQLYYDKYFAKVHLDIQFLINTFQKKKTDEVELIATLFACLKEAKKEKAIVTDKLIIQKVYAWNKSKQKFAEDEIRNSLRWMEENGVYPV